MCHDVMFDWQPVHLQDACFTSTGWVLTMLLCVVAQVAGIIVEDSLEELERSRAEAAQQAAAQEAKRKKEEQRARQAAAKAAQEAAAAAGLPPALSALAAIADKAARREAAKQAMASSSQRLLAAPEEHVGELRTLIALAADGDAHVARLAQLSLLVVFKDIVPGYRIRPPAEREQQVSRTDCWVCSSCIISPGTCIQ